MVPEVFRGHPQRPGLCPAAGPLAVLIVAVTLLAVASPPVRAQTGLRLTVEYPAGWNLVGAPTGTLVGGTDGPLYSLEPGQEGYTPLPAGTPLQGGRGYWAYFADATRVQMPADEPADRSIDLPAGELVLIGNPLPYLATVVGADLVMTYDPIQGYHETTELQPGQGAWAYSRTGATLVVGRLSSASPEDAALARRLSPLLVQTGDLPSDLSVLQPVDLLAVDNANYVRLRPDAIELQARLNLLGRLGGVSASWSHDVDYAARPAEPLGVSNVISLYGDAQGAAGGLALIFDRIARAPSSDCTRAAAPALAPIGDASRAERFDCTFNQLLDAATARTVLVQASYLILGWQHGDVVVTLQLSAINQDPSSADLQQLAALVEARLQAAGY